MRIYHRSCLVVVNEVVVKHLVIWKMQNLYPRRHHLYCVSHNIAENIYTNSPLLSGDLKASVVPCGMESASVPRAGVASIVCSL